MRELIGGGAPNAGSPKTRTVKARDRAHGFLIGWILAAILAFPVAASALTRVFAGW